MQGPFGITKIPTHIPDWWRRTEISRMFLYRPSAQPTETLPRCSSTHRKSIGLQTNNLPQEPDCWRNRFSIFHLDFQMTCRSAVPLIHSFEIKINFFAVILAWVMACLYFAPVATDSTTPQNCTAVWRRAGELASLQPRVSELTNKSRQTPPAFGEPALVTLSPLSPFHLST